MPAIAEDHRWYSKADVPLLTAAKANRPILVVVDMKPIKQMLQIGNFDLKQRVITICTVVRQHNVGQ